MSFANNPDYEEGFQNCMDTQKLTAETYKYKLEILKEENKKWGFWKSFTAVTCVSCLCTTALEIAHIFSPQT